MRKSAYPSLSEINVTNLVDVILVLLIIFMLTAPFLQGGVEIELPKVEAAPLPTDEGLSVQVFPDSSIQVDDKPVSLANLEAHLRLVHPAGSKKPVYLQAHGRLPYAYIVDLMARMNRAGLEDVGLVTEPPEQEEPRGR